MKIIKVFTLILFLFAPLLSAAEPAETFAEANNLYKTGQFIEAINKYEFLVKQDYRSAELFYNLGNAYFRTGNLGLTILNYERGLKLDPGDEDLRHNLAFVNQRTVDKIETLPRFFLFDWWEALLASFTFYGWTIAAFIIYFFLLSAAAGYFFFKDPAKQKYSFFAAIILSAILLFTAVILSAKFNREFKIENGIVVATAVTVKSSPDQQSSDTFVVHEGLKIKVEDKLESWFKVRLPDGKVGWIERSEVRLI